MPKLIKLPPIQGVAANTTGSLPQVPHGMTYDAIILALSGTTFTKAMLPGIRGNINGKGMTDITGTHLDVVNRYKGMVAAAAYLSINFAERKARTINGEQMGSVDTSVGVDTFDWEFDIGAATAPKLEAYALISPPKPVMINGQPNPYKRMFSAVLKKTHPLTGAAPHAVTIPMGSRLGGFIKRVHWNHTGNVTHIEARRDNEFLQQGGDVALVSFIQGEINRVSVANHECFDPCFTDNQSDAVPTLRRDGSPASFEFTVTTSATDTVVSYTEMYSDIARL